MSSRSTYKVITNEVKVIRILRLQRKLSVSKAAVRVGTNKSNLTALENGRINLSEEWITKIIKGYGYSPEDFKNLIAHKVSTKDELLSTIMEHARTLSYEQLQIIERLIGSYQ